MKKIILFMLLAVFLIGCNGHTLQIRNCTPVLVPVMNEHGGYQPGGAGFGCTWDIEEKHR
jgi:hypothetical protein